MTKITDELLDEVLLDLFYHLIFNLETHIEEVEKTRLKMGQKYFLFKKYRIREILFLSSTMENRSWPTAYTNIWTKFLNIMFDIFIMIHGIVNYSNFNRAYWCLVKFIQFQNCTLFDKLNILWNFWNGTVGFHGSFWTKMFMTCYFPASTLSVQFSLTLETICCILIYTRFTFLIQLGTESRKFTLKVKFVTVVKEKHPNEKQTNMK